jgi:putative methionine-R-sulfoxide reductase with GAF domain
MCENSDEEGFMKDGELGRVFASGEVICKEGEKGETMYVVQSGEIKISKESSSGEFTIATLRSGDIFGEMALFDKMPRSATATALGEARVLSVDKKKLFSSISRDPTLVFKIIETMSKRIRTLNDELPRLKKEKICVLQACMNVDDTCTLVLEEAENIISADNGSLMLLDESGESLEIKAAFGKEENPKVNLPPGEGIAGNVLKTGKAELVNNVTADSRYVNGKMRITSLLCVPLKFSGKCFGVMNMSSSSERLFTLKDLQLLHSLAIYASIAIQNAKNYSHLQDAADKILINATMLDIL